MPHASILKSFAPVQTWLPPWGLSACVRAVLWRSTAGLALDELQRWGHFPASPMCSINCLSGGSAEIPVTGTGCDPSAPRQRVAKVSATGPHTAPVSVFYGPQAQGVMVLLYPDAWYALTDVAPQTLINRVVDARDVLPSALLAASERLCEAGDANARVQRFFEELWAVWQQRTSKHLAQNGPDQNWAQALAPWTQALAMRAAATDWGRSLRQSERRIKQWTGWSLRKLQGAARGEAAFFAVMEAIVEDRLDWTQIALEQGFSDQSHFIRETRRITGFSPEALRHGFTCEEAFWLYRAWAKLAGYESDNTTKSAN